MNELDLLNIACFTTGLIGCITPVVIDKLSSKQKNTNTEALK